jgi:PAS domain S-box-containing protein
MLKSPLYLDLCVGGRINYQHEILGALTMQNKAKKEEIRKKVTKNPKTKERDAMFQAILDSSRDVIVLFNLQNQRYEYVSPSVKDLVGFTPDEFSGMDIKAAIRMVHPDDLPAFRSAISLAETTGIGTAEYRQKTKSGGYVWISNHMSIIKDAGGNPLYRNSNLRDVTELKQAEEKLKSSEEKYRNLFVNMTEGFALCDIVVDSRGKPADYRVLEANQAWEELTGLSRSKIIGKPLKHLIRELEQYWIDNYGKVALSGEPLQLENYNKFTHRWYEIYAYSPAKGYFVSLVKNITNRKKTEEALKQSEEHFSLALRNTDITVATLDKNRIYTWVYNSRHGFAPEQIVGKRAEELLPLEEIAETVDMQKRVLKTGVSERREISRLTGGKEYFYDAVMEPQLGENGEISGLNYVAIDITERKNVESQLRESEQRYRALVDLAPDAILVHCDGNIYYANNSAIRMFGAYTVNELAKHNLLDLIDPQDREDARTSVQAVEQGKTTVMTERMAFRLDGRRWVLEAAGTPVRWNNKTCVQVIIRDITERKKLDEQLRQRAEELKTVMDLVPAAIWVAYDPECHNITGNRRANEFYEAKEGENVSAGPASGEPIPPRRFFRNGKELKAEELPMQEAAAQNQDVTGSEFEVEVPSGKLLTLLGSASPLRDEKGKVRGAVAAFLDITARKEVEQQNFEHLHILEQANVFVRDMEGKIIFWNQGAEKIYGYSTEESIGKISNELLQTVFPKPLHDIVKDLTENGKWEGDLIHTRKDGAKIISSSVWTFYKGDKNHPGMIIEANTDITERKKAEEALSEYSKNLEIAYKELEAFSYSVSHDLKAPLRSLDSFSEILIEDYKEKIDETGQDYLNRIRKASQTMSQLINDMLRLSRIIRTDLQVDTVDITWLVQLIASDLQKNQTGRKVKFIIAPDISVAGDERLLEICLKNLMENAWKFTAKNQNALIEFGETKQDEEKVYFIKDNGVGFDMAYKDKLFQPFQRLHTDKEYPGTGIGLAIVQRIIRRHGGRIWAESEVGKGTTFYFTIGTAAKTPIE